MALTNALAGLLEYVLRAQNATTVTELSESLDQAGLWLAAAVQAIPTPEWDANWQPLDAAGVAPVIDLTVGPSSSSSSAAVPPAPPLAPPPAPPPTAVAPASASTPKGPPGKLSWRGGLGGHSRSPPPRRVRPPPPPPPPPFKMQAAPAPKAESIEGQPSASSSPTADGVWL